MNLPEREELPMKVVAFMDGAKGMATHKFSNEKLGIALTKHRENSLEEFKETWTMKGVAGEFDNYDKLREAAKGLK